MKRFLSLLLAVAMLLSIGSALADEKLTKVTLRILTSTNEYAHKDDLSDAPQYLKDWYEYVKYQLIPGYEITIEWMPYESRQEQIALLLAGGDVPDIIYCDGASWYEYWQTGFFQEDLMPYLEQYGQNILKYIDPEVLDVCTVDGNLVAIPGETDAYNFGTYIRTDWLQKLGFEVKDTYTLSELKEIWTAFTFNDPDGNGINDTYGLGAATGGHGFRDVWWPQTFHFIFGCFGGSVDWYYHVYQNEEGYLYTYDYSDDFRAALDFINECWEAGIIDPEIFLVNDDQALIKVSNSQVGTYCGDLRAWRNGVRDGLTEITPSARLGHIYVTGDDGRTGMKGLTATSAPALVSANCKYPEAAIAFMDFLMTPEGNSKGYMTKINEETYEIEYDCDVTGMSKFEKQQHEVIVDINGNQITNWLSLLNEDWTELDKYNLGWRETYGGLPSPLDLTVRSDMINIVNYPIEEPDWTDDPAVYDNDVWRNRYTDYINQERNLLYYNPDNHHMYNSEYANFAATTEQVDYLPALITHRTDWFVAFVTGTKDIDNDADWAEYCNEAVKKGAELIMKSFAPEWEARNGVEAKFLPIGK